MEFEQSDAVELFHIIRSRGFSATRSKLLEVLFQLDKELAERINREDNFDTLAAEMARQS